jgi:anaerobic selenocysteine-containing dehydrogenase
LLNALTRAEEGEGAISFIGEGPGHWVATSCQGCTTWCPFEVFVQNGRAVKVRGNRHSKQNDGTCCPRGHIGLQQLYDPDRIKVPMKRTNPEKGRGVDPKFVPITWDERGRYTYMRDMLYDAMTKIIGSPNNISHSAICAEAEKFGPYYTEGLWDYRDYDISNSKYLLIWGCDPVSSNRMVPASIRRFGDVLDKATVAVVDPRLQASAAKAHEWLPVKPGEDGALASAIAHVILTEGLWHKEFVGDFADGNNRFETGKKVSESSFQEQHTHGLVKWWNIELKDKNPEWAEKITGIPKDQIVRVARGMGKAAPNVTVWLGPGACMQVRGGYTAMAVHALNGLVGSVDNVGGPMAKASIPAGSIPDVKAYQDEIAAKHTKNKKIDQRGTKEFPSLNGGKSGGGVVTNNAADGMLKQDPYDIKMAIGYMNNFTFSCTGAQRWEKAMENLPFYVHLTTHPAEMTQYADIVLPCAITTYEKWGFLKNKANRYAYNSLIQPVVTPMWDVRIDETEIPFLIAEKLAAKGFSNLLDYFKNELKDPETGKSPATGAEFAEYAVKFYTSPVWDGKKDVGGDKINGWEEFKKRGLWNSSPYEYKKRWGAFKTETKKFEFYSETLKKALKSHADKHKTSINDILKTCKYEANGELAFVPHYEKPYLWGDEKEYPFAFVDYKSRLNREGRSQNAPWYMEFKKMDVGDESWDDVLKMNPADTARLGIKAGDMVKVTSVNGSFIVKAKPWEGIGPGMVTKCYGQGHWAYGRVAAKDYRKAEPRGVNNNEIMPADYDRLSGSTARNGGFTRVKIEKA